MWFPDGKRIVFSGHDGHNWRTYVQEIAGGEPQVIGDMFCPCLSDDGSRFAAAKAAGPDNPGYAIYSAAGRKIRDLPGMQGQQRVLRWSADGRALYVQEFEGLEVFRLDITTGRRTLWRKATPAGYSEGGSFVRAADEKSYAYSYSVDWEELNIAEGLK
jgi:Tol biopolymer transport system component